MARFGLGILLVVIELHVTAGLSNEGKTILDIVLWACRNHISCYRVVSIAGMACACEMVIPQTVPLLRTTASDYGGVNRTGPMLAQPENYLLCCEAAGGYVDTVVQNLTLDISQSSSCSSSYNEQPEGNFNQNNFNNLEQQTQYVFPSIQFGCKGCISNVTFYTRSQQQPADFTIFNILLWGTP